MPSCPKHRKCGAAVKIIPELLQINLRNRRATGYGKRNNRQTILSPTHVTSKMLQKS